MDNEVALWQRGLEDDDDQPDLGPAGYLFEASTTTFSAMLQLLASNADHLDPGAYQRLRNEFQKFYMWNEGFSTRSGELDYILASSKNLKSTVLGLLVQWVTAVSKVPSTLSEYDWSTIVPALAELEVLAHKADQVAKAVMMDMKSQCFALRDANVNYDSDSDSESISSLSDTTFEDLIEDLGTYMEGLVDLAPSLEHPATDIFIHDTGTAPIDDLSSVPEAARPFVVILKDRFPSIDPGLGRKLGEANWFRRERLKEKLASAPPVDSTPTPFTDDRSDGDTVIAPNYPSAQHSAPSVPSTVRPPSHYQSVTTQSTFSDPSLFDTNSIAAPRYRRNIPVAESVTSFVTSLAEGPEYGQRRVPHLPDNHDFDAPFQCQVCGEIQLNIRNRADWKNHVYHDLEPYVCLFTDCNLGIHTFRSRREWMEHEFQVHRVVEQWRCNLCDDTFYTQDHFRSHIHRVHEEHSVASQNEEVISAARRAVARNASLETCPFCLTSPAQTQKGFASHVGRHQQEISLAALPNLEMNSEEGDSDDDNDDSDDNDDDDEGSRTNSSIKTDASNRTLQLRPSDDNANGPSTDSTHAGGASEDEFNDEHPQGMPSDTQPEEEIQDIPLDLSRFPLHEAAYNGDLDRMAALLAASTDHDIDQPIGQYGTPLQVASLNGHTSVVRCLLDRSADVNVHAGKYGTALQAAAAEGHVEIAKALLDTGASVNKRAGMYRNALQAASSNGHESMFKLLLNHGARTDGVYAPDGKPARRSEDLASNLLASDTSTMTPTNSDSISAERKLTLDKLTAAAPNIDEKKRDGLKPPATSASKTDLSVSYDSLLAELGYDFDDDVYPCKGCGEILEEGKAFELAGNRWHLDCFRCNKCGILLNSDANLLLLGDGSLICNNCTYACSSCGKKIEDLAILTGDQAFCATCFSCRNCKRKIENLRYAKTSQGIFCMSCHESLMARRRKKMKLEAEAAEAAESSKSSQLDSYSLDKSLPALPPNFAPGPFSDETSRNPRPPSPKRLWVPAEREMAESLIDPPSRAVSITHPSSSMPRPQSGSIGSAEKPERETEEEKEDSETSLYSKRSEITTKPAHTSSGPPSSAERYPELFPEVSSPPETPKKRNRFSARDLLFGRGNRSK